MISSLIINHQITRKRSNRDLEKKQTWNGRQDNSIDNSMQNQDQESESGVQQLSQQKIEECFRQQINR